MNLSEVRWIEIHHANDTRGTLTALERPALPFDVKRVFYMHRVPDGHERGGHAHRSTTQLVIAIAGAVTLDVSDGEKAGTFVLDDPNRGLFVPPMTWVRLYDFLPVTVALVLCDTVYNAAHVVRSWDDYCRLMREPSLT